MGLGGMCVYMRARREMVLSISLRFEHAYSMPSLAARTSCGWSFTEIAQPGIHWSPEAADTLRECHVSVSSTFL